MTSATPDLTAGNTGETSTALQQILLFGEEKVSEIIRAQFRKWRAGRPGDEDAEAGAQTFINAVNQILKVDPKGVHPSDLPRAKERDEAGLRFERTDDWVLLGVFWEGFDAAVAAGQYRRNQITPERLTAGISFGSSDFEGKHEAVRIFLKGWDSAVFGRML